MKSKTKIVILSLFGLLSAKSVFAICPVCTVAVGAGVGLSRWLGIDDTIVGLWIGGLTVSLIMWTVDWLDRKNWKFKGRKILITLGYYALIVVPLFYVKIGGTTIMGHPFNKMWGIDKLLLGIIVGSVFFFLGSLSYIHFKKKNNNRAHFPFQKIAMAICPLIVLSVIFYWLTK